MIVLKIAYLLIAIPFAVLYAYDVIVTTPDCGMEI